MTEHVFGAAGSEVVVEDFLAGEEASFFALCDGTHAIPLGAAQDHKRVYDGDRGPNTGGMGAYSPAPVVTPELHARIMAEVMEPTVAGRPADALDGAALHLAFNVRGMDGRPRVLEYNCRFGDPETQPILMRLRSDLVALCLAALDGRLAEMQADWDPRPALGVVMAAGGYPERYQKGGIITGLEAAAELADTKVFHAGTLRREGQTLTNGGRVLCVTALGETVSAAQARAFAAVNRIHWQDGFYRRDIGHRAIAREKGAVTP